MLEESHSSCFFVCLEKVKIVERTVYPFQPNDIETKVKITSSHKSINLQCN
jgi:hypothetical protein